MQEPNPIGDDSDCARLVAEKNWAATPLGPVESWPQSLRTSLSICLACDFPILLWWGPHKVMLYNDEYIPVLGKKHPAAIGGLGHEVWADVWSVVGPMLEQVASTGKAVKAEDLLLLMNRYGYDEEAYFSFSYSPIADESGGVGGIFTPVIETTEKVIGQRRVERLRQLGSLGRADGLAQACEALAQSLSGAPEDLPFGLIYAIDPDGAGATLAASFGLDEFPEAAPARIDATDASRANASPWPVLAAARASTMQTVDGLDHTGVALPRGSWGAPVAQAVAIPITFPGQDLATAVLVAAVSPHRALDEVYLSFYTLLADQVDGIVGSALSNEAERKRAEALAQIDRAKTTFFSNVSHEFRTPLTLMLGPLAELRDDAGLPEAVRERLQLIERNGMRMLKLVNGLLDFSRIEAGRMVANFEPVDLGQLTGELAAVFRSAVERAGLRYEVDCAPFDEPAYVDRAMWEKIVLNLLSNAFKYTFEGGIAVRVRVHAGAVELSVRDTGVGVAEADLPRLFERFHRIEGSRSRSHEGSGIGLALVRDLVELHGGQARIDSRLGEGSCVTVTLPLGRAHLPHEQVTERGDWREANPAHSIQASAHMAEAELWLGAGRVEPAPAAAPSGATVFVVDDNADMRDYVAGLLAPAYAVRSFADGAQALAAARHARPEVIVSDVMMPVMDGYTLLAALKADRLLSTVPVLLLSARAGEEERISASRAGADDYLEKPFSSRELLAKVDALLLRARIRELETAHGDRIDTIFRQAPVAIALLRGPEHVFELANPHYLEVVGGRQVLGLPMRQAVPELDQQGICAQLDEVYRSGTPFLDRALRVDLLRGAPPALQERFFNLVYQPTFGSDGAVDGIAVVAVDVTDTVLARRAAETANRAKDEFMAMLGHELRNPLAPIMTALEVMRLRGIGAVQKEHGIIERQARHLVGLVNDLLDVARISRGKVTLRREPTELAAVVANAVETASPLLEGRQHILQLQVPKQGLVFDADRQRMGQVIANLLTNAAKYSDPGSTITVRGRREGGELVLEVGDTGRGIAPDLLPHLFDMFYQDPQSLSRSQGGLGLGLAIVRSLAELHGGTVSAASAGLRQGATFTVRLPAASACGAGAGPAPAGIAAAPDAHAGLPAVLVVDDNEDAAEMLGALLGSVGYRVDTACDGPSALRKLDGAWPGIAILDIGLPGMDGYELAGRIRQLAAARGHGVKLVALSGYGQDSDVRRALAAGFDRHIAKPVSLHALQDLFHTLAARAAAPG